MPTIIKDGAGSGKAARVNSENRLDVESVSRAIDQHINELYEKMFTLPFDGVDPTGADDYFLYFKNTGTKNLHVEAMQIRSTVAGTVEVHHVSGTASSGTTLTPVNRYLGSSETIDATIETGVDITGLTNEGVLDYIRCAATDTNYKSEISSHIIIPPGQALALLWDTGTGVLSGTIDVYEDQGVV